MEVSDHAPNCTPCCRRGLTICSGWSLGERNSKLTERHIWGIGVGHRYSSRFQKRYKFTALGVRGSWWRERNSIFAAEAQKSRLQLIFVTAVCCAYDNVSTGYWVPAGLWRLFDDIRSQQLSRLGFPPKPPW